MSYAKQATSAKDEARDILRTQMAGRVLTRIEETKALLVSSIKAVANAMHRFAKEDTKLAKEAEERAAIRDSFGQALGQIELSADETALVSEAVAKTQKDNDAKLAEEAEKRKEQRTAELAELNKDVVAARKNLAHHEDNLAKIESGTLKVDADELKALADKLLEDGRIEAGTVGVAG